MSPGGLNGSGVHPLPRLDEPRRKPKPRVGLIASVVGALATLGGGGAWFVQHVDARVEAVAIAKLEAKGESHDKELIDIHKALDKHTDRIEDMAVFLGVPRDYRNAPNLGVVPLPAATHPRPKPREPQ